jgi:phosphoribosylanthranilate isomerase
MSVRVKICGITRVEDAIAAVEAGADFLGLNFYEKSPRCVTVARALEIKRAIDSRASLVALFVDAGRERIIEVSREVGLDFAQVYSDEDEDTAAAAGIAVIRAIRLKADAVRDEIEALRKTARADYLLFDSYDAALYGGSGKSIELVGLARIDLGRVFIAGGLKPETVAEAARLNPYGVDVASGVESAPGIKNHQKMRSFIANAKRPR